MPETLKYIRNPVHTFLPYCLKQNLMIDSQDWYGVGK